ncbi:MAG: hypothetical protein AAGK04_12315, partial [Planctomycetota bacterium]
MSEIEGQLRDRDVNFFGNRFGLRVPVLMGTVCTFEDTGNWSGPWDNSDSGGFFFNGSTFAIADNFVIDAASTANASEEINTLCTEGVYASGGVLMDGDTIPDQFEVNYWGNDPGTNLPDVFEIFVSSPASGLQPFVEGTNLTKLETPNQNFFGGASSIFQLEHADVSFDTGNCFTVQILNNQTASGGATLFLTTGSNTTFDGQSLQDTNNSLDFTADEDTGADIAIALYDRNDTPAGADWDLDFFLISTIGGPSNPLGTFEGICNYADVVPEPTAGFCDTATVLTVGGGAMSFDMDVPGTEQVDFGRAGSFVENCPIGTLGVNTDIQGNFGLFYNVVGDGTTLTASTCGSATTQNTILMVYAESDPANPCEVLYCLGGDDDGCGTAGGPAEFSWASVAGVTYKIMIQSAGFTQGLVEVTSDGMAAFDLGDASATTEGETQTSAAAIAESETCAAGQSGLGTNDGCGGPNDTSAEAEMLADGEIRSGTSSNIQLSIADRGPDMNGFGPDPAAEVIDA